jgi:hypothetical protein
MALGPRVAGGFICGAPVRSQCLGGLDGARRRVPMVLPGVTCPSALHSADASVLLWLWHFAPAARDRPSSITFSKVRRDLPQA